MAEHNLKHMTLEEIVEINKRVLREIKVKRETLTAL